MNGSPCINHRFSGSELLFQRVDLAHDDCSPEGAGVKSMEFSACKAIWARGSVDLFGLGSVVR